MLSKNKAWETDLILVEKNIITFLLYICYVELALKVSNLVLFSCSMSANPFTHDNENFNLPFCFYEIEFSVIQ